MELKIEGLNDQGSGVGYIDGKVCFVPKSMVGDVVKIIVLKEHKNYIEGVVEEYVSRGNYFREEFCPYFKRCGGCQLQNMDYDKTLEYKKNKLEKILEKFANISVNVDMISSKKDKNYRNKITLKVVDGCVGYYAYRTNEIVEVNKCDLVDESINDFISLISDFKVKNGEVVIRCNYNQELLIVINSDDEIVIPKFDDKRIVGIILNDKLIYGEDHFIEIIDGRFYQVSYNSFFQVNRDICKDLFRLLNENIIEDSVVLDLYCGVGTLGIAVKDKVKKIYGIEVVENAIKNALVNKKMNKVDNALYMLGDVAKVLDKINEKIDVVLVDPPRMGLDKCVIDMIIEYNPKQIIYISCDPITLARDLRLFSDSYDVKKVVGMDMFCWTYHVESFVVLKRK